mgnify:CR=1 FL=1
MSNFKVGEICIIVGTFSGRTDVIGIECEVVRGYGPIETVKQDGSQGTRIGYGVVPIGQWNSYSGLGKLVVAPHHLRRKPPKTTTWADVAAVTGWTPAGEPA